MPALDEFEGNWRIARRIEDSWAGTTGLFEGVARFVPDAGGLTYHEVGELRVPHEVPMTARRRYLWRPGKGAIEVLYDDERPFHRIGPGPVAQDLHACGGDLYEVSYNFTHWPAWRMIWRVTGPRKDYVSISDFRR